MSLPSRECGLKFLILILYRTNRIYVTPFTGVWIEIFITSFSSKILVPVTPFTGVWIEINIRIIVFNKILKVTPFAGVWIEIINPTYPYFSSNNRHFLRGSVDWNFCVINYNLVCCCHSLRGSVDWNCPTKHTIFKKPCVTPFMGVWIEICFSFTSK